MIRGFNTDSGLLYNRSNGLKQYSSKKPLFPFNNTPDAEFRNIDQTREMLKSMTHSGRRFKGKSGLDREIPNDLQQDGGFARFEQGNTKPQVKRSRLKLPEEAVKIASLTQPNPNSLPNARMNSEEKSMTNAFARVNKNKRVPRGVILNQ